MLLTVDVGNTNIAMGILNNSEIVGRYRLTTNRTRTSDEYGFYVRELLRQSGLMPEDIHDVIISSVVPKIMYSLSSCMIKYLGKKPIIVNSELKTGITLDVETPSSVGADRIVNTVYAYQTYKRS